MNLTPTPETVLPGLNRRSFLHRSGLLAALTPAAAILLGEAPQAEAALPFPPGLQLDLAILNFALNTEYLEAEYYTRGVFGMPITVVDPTVQITGSGTPGDVTIKANPAVPFATPALKSYAMEIALDEIAHVKFLRNTIAGLGGMPVARPALDLLNSYNTVAINAGIAGSFDPFANEVNFYLGGFSLTDVGVTAYHGAAPLITDKKVLSGSAGILAVEAYHDSTLRLSIYRAGGDAITNAQKISSLRDKLDDNGKRSKDQGVANADGSPNIVPTDANSIIFARTFRQVLNIVYGGYKAPPGGFFPNGLNGDIR